MPDNASVNVPLQSQSQSIDEMIAKAKEIYERLKVELNLESTNLGKYIAIDPKSERYFIGETRDEAVKAGKSAIPNELFFVKRIGGIDKVARSYAYSTFSELDYARLF